MMVNIALLHYLKSYLFCIFTFLKKTGFGDPNVIACDPKVGRDPAVEKHCSRGSSYKLFLYPIIIFSSLYFFSSAIGIG